MLLLFRETIPTVYILHLLSVTAKSLQSGTWNRNLNLQNLKQKQNYESLEGSNKENSKKMISRYYEIKKSLLCNK